MSGLREELLAQLARFDDDAYVALANRGLLRRARKDLEQQEAVIIEETPEQLLVGLGEQRIRFDARGPAAAQCSCPAGGVCQHILAAAIALQRSAPAVSTAGHNPDSDQADSAEISRLHNELLALNREALVKHAGKPGYRWAWQFVQDLDPEAGVTISGERHIVIGFRHPRLTLHYMGGGIGSLVADVQTSQLAKQQVAAVLAYRRAHGKDDAPLEQPPPKSAALDLGKDHALADSTAEVREMSRERLRASVLKLLENAIELGLSHLSANIHERFTTMAVWAQGAEYYRLAAMLRRLADHVEMLLERTGGADEHRLYDEMAFTYGLVSALAAAEQRGSAPTHLIGRARTRYEETAAMEVLGMGAHAWRASSGYLGLTMLFWSPADSSFYACTDARPELQRAFNPVARYTAVGPWAGLAAPSHATGRRVRLIGAKCNAQRRLSATDATQADVRPAGTEWIARLVPHSNWAKLTEVRAMTNRSLLAVPEPMNDWVVLAPASFAPAQFDAIRQTLVWPVLDDEGAPLALELQYSEYTEHAIQRIEQLSSDRVQPGSMVVARVRRSPAGLVGEPLSIIRPAPGRDENPVDALHFDPAPKAGAVSKFMLKFRNRLHAGQPENNEEGPSTSGTQHRALLEFKHWLQHLAERGFAEGQIAGYRREFGAELGKLAASGYAMMPEARVMDGPFSDLLLKANYLCMQYEKLLDGTQGEMID